MTPRLLPGPCVTEAVSQEEMKFESPARIWKSVHVRLAREGKRRGQLVPLLFAVPVWSIMRTWASIPSADMIVKRGGGLGHLLRPKGAELDPNIVAIFQAPCTCLVDMAGHVRHFLFNSMCPLFVMNS